MSREIQIQYTNFTGKKKIHIIDLQSKIYRYFKCYSREI